MDDPVVFFRHALAQALPGPAAQETMMPRSPDGRRRSFSQPSDARHSAVAVVLRKEQDRPAVLLTLRSAMLRHHRGQLSFPGGRIERGETPTDAALRELSEEVGLPSRCVEVLGVLSPLYTPPSNSFITPVVMWCSAAVALSLDPSEVEEAFWVRLEELVGSAVEEEWELPYGRMIVPHWRVHPRVPLWGATAMILAELIELYSQWLTRQTAPAGGAAGGLHPAARADQ
ncbi:MAG: CoA pyrophosphatase [Chlorobiota bacterium]|nr:MAG: CoA pyrophosphatase [Chlorobiota bacterium]